jgi:hypothetical protein
MLSKVIDKNPMVRMFKAVFAGVLGGMSALMVIGLFSLLFFGAGYYIIQKYNKPGSKPLKELQNEQYFGIVLCIIGALPWIQYFFMGFLGEAGGAAFGELFDGGD